MNAVRKFLSEASKKLELPAEVVSFVPKMELTGTEEFSIEPHKGLLEYEKERISLDSSVGTVLIFGSELRIKQMNHQRITLVGQIHSVELQGNQIE